MSRNAYFVHPAWLPRLVRTDRSPALPLTESDLPSTWRALSPAEQDVRLRQAWETLVEWVLAHGADRIRVSLPKGRGRRHLEERGFKAVAGGWLEAHADYAGLSAVVDCEPDYVQVLRQLDTLLEVHDTWDGIEIFPDGTLPDSWSHT